jgi:uncharacterized membrane protein YidH (DUF202 family)
LTPGFLAAIFDTSKRKNMGAKMQTLLVALLWVIAAYLIAGAVIGLLLFCKLWQEYGRHNRKNIGLSMIIMAAVLLFIVGACVGLPIWIRSQFEDKF